MDSDKECSTVNNSVGANNNKVKTIFQVGILRVSLSVLIPILVAIVIVMGLKGLSIGGRKSTQLQL